MRRRLLVLLCLVAAVGCNRFSGPLETRRMGKVDPKQKVILPNGEEADVPIYSIPEQQQRGRERLSIPEDDFRIGPNTYSSRPSPTGR